MKKKVCGILIALVLVVTIIVLILTFYGNRLVATKDFEVISYLDGEKMKYEDKREFSFKKDKINKVKITFKYEDAKDAEEMYTEYKEMLDTFKDEINREIEYNGNEIVMKFDAEAYAEFVLEDELQTKDKLKEELEKKGYEVK